MTDPRFHPPPSYPQSSPPGRPGLSASGWQQTQPARRRGAPGWVIALAVATAVLSVVSFTTVLLWPRGDDPDPGPVFTGPLDFHAFNQVTRIDFDRPSRTSFTVLFEDRAYVAWEQGGDLELLAVDPATGEQQWRDRVTGAARWRELFAVPGAVVAVGSDGDGGLHLYAHDAASGHELWNRAASAEDSVVTSEEIAVWFRGETGQLQGLDIATGTERWSVPVSTDVSLVWTLTEADLARPTDAEGFLGPVGTVPRLVVVDSDRSATVVDGRDGTVVSSAENIARPQDELAVFEDRLYVAADESGFQLESYPLDNLAGVPRVHYRAGSNVYPERLEPCGTDRICLLEYEDFDREATEVVTVDIAGEAGALWRHPVPAARNLVPVGSLLFVAGDELRDEPVVGYDEAGQEVLRRPGVVARLNADNLLVFAEPPDASESDLGVAGVTVGDDGPTVTELGQLPGVVGGSCTWNVTHVGCPDQEGARIWSFASTD